MRQMKKRVIYSNYDIWDDYEKDARELLLERDVQDPTEQQIWDECSFLSEMEWSDTKDVIDSFLKMEPTSYVALPADGMVRVKLAPYLQISGMFIIRQLRAVTM
jgi:hypothetical protein